MLIYTSHDAPGLEVRVAQIDGQHYRSELLVDGEPVQSSDRVDPPRTGMAERAAYDYAATRELLLADAVSEQQLPMPRAQAEREHPGIEMVPYILDQDDMQRRQRREALRTQLAGRRPYALESAIREGRAQVVEN